MLRVLSDALSAADSRQLTLLALLDMTAAFDCVDHGWTATATIAAEFRPYWQRLTMDDIIPDRSDAAGAVRRQT